MKSLTYCKLQLRNKLLVGLLLAVSPHSFGQGNNVVAVTLPDKVTAKMGAPVQAKMAVQLRAGYHVNSNMPAEAYLIPLKLTWNAGALEAAEIVYPKPQMEKYSFSETPLSVFSGEFDILTKFKVSATAVSGPTAITGKLRYQACNDRMCLPPKNVDVALQIDVVK
jgi:thiol:disulfide interchange protein DsbD